MSKQLEKELKIYDNRVFGFKVSEYGLENGYLDYYTLSLIVGACILNNNIVGETGFENWDIENGYDYDDEEDYYYEIYQYYIISDFGAQFLKDYTDEIVYYNEALDMYVWGITHFGTSWDYVLTDIKLKGDDIL